MSLLLNYTKTVLFMTSVQAFRYTFLAGGTCWILSRLPESWKVAHRIQAVPIQNQDLVREVKNSVVTIAFYGFLFATIFNPTVRPLTRIYLHADEKGWLWFLISFPILVLIHDTYFYWMHRALHVPAIFKKAHRVHHLSTNPTPLASQSFHPIEAFFEMVWIVPVICLIPIHLKVLIAFSVFSMSYNVYGHLGVEIFPVGWRKLPILKWLNTATHHNGHHKYYVGNFGLYFLFWDRWLKTERTVHPT